MSLSARSVIAFWTDIGPERWFVADPDLDALLRANHLALHEAAARGDLPWADEPEGALALLLLLDQFPRNMFRGAARAFATDSRALALAGRSIARGFDRAHPHVLRQFFYLPFMHAEDLAQQRRSEALYTAHGDANALRYAVIHREIIERFGRFPHRNSALGRITTPAEQAFLDAGGWAG